MVVRGRRPDGRDARRHRRLPPARSATELTVIQLCAWLKERIAVSLNSDLSLIAATTHRSMPFGGRCQANSDPFSTTS